MKKTRSTESEDWRGETLSKLRQLIKEADAAKGASAKDSARGA